MLLLTIVKFIDTIFQKCHHTEDYGSLDEYLIGDLFVKAVEHSNILTIDVVYIFYSYPDNFIIVPLKIMNHYFPNIDKFDSFLQKQYEMM